MRRKPLRSGFTTGTAAAAAAKAALLTLLTGREPQAVEIELLTGERLRIPVLSCRRFADGRVTCSVIKDAGDDPDVTHGAEIGAILRLGTAPAGADGPAEVLIRGGMGVGRVTKPGLEVPPGEPAINPGPRRMITAAVREVLTQHGRSGPIEVEVVVPRGEEIARRTLNARLGILGGISILGTTGVVQPLSHEAFVATIEAGLAVARAGGLSTVVLTTGRRSERFAQTLWPELPEEAFVQIGDYFRRSLQIAAAKGFAAVRLAVFFGKALKMARGDAQTHAARSALTLTALAQWAAAGRGGPRLAQRIGRCHTAREAFALIAPAHPELLAEVVRRIAAAAGAFAGRRPQIQVILLDYEGRLAFDSQAASAP